MNNFENQIEEILKLDSIKDFANINLLFSNLRQILERDNNFANFPKIQMFSNWILHPELNRKNSAESILLEMRNAIIDHYENETPIGENLSRAINLPELRNELRNLFTEYGISNSKINQNQYWDDLAITLLKLITEKPISFSNLPDLVATNPIPYDFKGFKLIEHEDKICYELLSDELERVNSRIVIELPKI